MDGAGTKVEAVSVGSDGVNDFEWADEFVVEFYGWASSFDVAAVDHDKGAGGEGRGVVGASVGVGVLCITAVGDGDEVGGSFVDGG